MQLAYGKLFQVVVEHGFFSTGPADHSIVPTLSCEAVLARLGARFRLAPGQVAVYAELDPAAPTPELRTPLGVENVLLSFSLTLGSPSAQRVTGLERYRPGREVFYFDNFKQGLN